VLLCPEQSNIYIRAVHRTKRFAALPGCQRFDRRRSLRVAAIIFCVIAATAPARAGGRAMLHATLLRSMRAADSRLEKSPPTIRLVFSERIVPELSRITLIGARGDSSQLKLAADAQDPHVLIGTVV